jgi:hypothetical protein
MSDTKLDIATLEEGKLREYAQKLLDENTQRVAAASRETDLLAKASTRVKPFRALGNMTSAALGVLESSLTEFRVGCNLDLEVTVKLAALHKASLANATTADEIIAIKAAIEAQ